MKKETSPTIDKSVLSLLNSELEGVKHGIVTVAIHVRDGKISRFVTNREKSMMPSDIGGGENER
ncbi:MAG: hypothetical protein GY754_00030 [bacterium]|nr:hypothetical protein [bacterium]